MYPHDKHLRRYAVISVMHCSLYLWAYKYVSTCRKMSVDHIKHPQNASDVGKLFKRITHTLICHEHFYILMMILLSAIESTTSTLPGKCLGETNTHRVGS